jgi:UDP-hydrolysing UDP-N-acetyl-D-glucosamine 2-epimerase
MPLKVALVTSTRADWGLLRPVARLLANDPAFALQIVATGSHLLPRFGMTVEAIEEDGFAVAARVPILDEGDDAAASLRALAAVTTSMGETLARLGSDIALVLGDRYEMLGVAQACLLSLAPLAHLCGGDVTEGAFDDSVRHAISKLSHLHFPTNADAARRLRRMGEAPDRIMLVGSTGLDNLRETPLLSREETFARLGLKPCDDLVLVTFHPPTLSEVSGERQFAELAGALDALGPEVAVALSGSNADPAGWAMTELARSYAERRPNAAFKVSMGGLLYLSTMRHARAIAGNSSSGLYEAPSFGVATVNVGDRQRGRLRAASVLDCPPERSAILACLRKALKSDFSSVKNPYGDGYSAPRVVARLKALTAPRDLLVKSFHEEDTS